MKKLLSSFVRMRLIALLPVFAFFWAGSLFAQSTVKVTPLSVTYTTTPTVRFRVSWTNQSTVNHPPKVWVIIDYDEVTNHASAKNWQRATITGTVATTNGTISQQSAHGFFLAGGSVNFSADVTVRLSGMPAKFNWCAFALDYPPQAIPKAGGGYDLYGAPPFTINGTIIEPSKTFAAGTCINTFTDATGNPAGIFPTVSPSLNLSSFIGSKNIMIGVAMSPIRFTTANIYNSLITAINLPPGLSVSWTNNRYTISGTPTSLGEFSYTVAAHGCPEASFAGTLTVSTAPESSMTNTYTPPADCNGSRTWSSPVIAETANCGYTLTKSSDNISYATYNPSCISAASATLCPSPWRVPTKADLDALYSCGGGGSGKTNAQNIQNLIGYYDATGTNRFVTNILYSGWYLSFCYNTTANHCPNPTQNYLSASHDTRNAWSVRCVKDEN